MAFTNYGFSDSHKLRVRLSAQATEVIENDMGIFKIKSFSDFFNTVISNFRDNAIASKTLFLQKKEREILNSLKCCNLQPDIRSQVCNTLLAQELNALEIRLEEFLMQKPNDDSKIRYINDDNIEYLENECLEDTQGTYKTPGAYLKCIIEEYCELPFRERERIVRADIVNLIEDAIAAKDCLKIKAEYRRKETTFFVKPYKIITDPLGGMNYLVCKSRPEGSPGAPKEPMIIASFALNRMGEPKRIKSESSRFTSAEENEIKERLQKTPPAYLTYYDEEEIHVKLTSTGKRKYQNLLFSRPIKDKAKSKEDEFVFFCSPRQAYNYFFDFGRDAEIISPLSLRNWFARDYKQAYAIYESNQ